MLLLKLINREETLNLLLGSDKYVNDKGGTEFSDSSAISSQKSDLLDSIFASNSKPHTISNDLCNYCRKLSFVYRMSFKTNPKEAKAKLVPKNVFKSLYSFMSL